MLHVGLRYLFIKNIMESECTVSAAERSHQQSTTCKLPTTTRIRTRKSTSHAVFGSSAPLPTNVLPTNGQVGKYFLYCKQRPKGANVDTLKMVTDEIIKVWQTASIPTIQKQSIYKRVAQFINRGSQLCRSGSSTRNQIQFSSTFGKLFDVCSCSCKITSTPRLDEVTVLCKCAKEEKVPQRELRFLQDQRTVRQMYIFRVDVPVTKKLTSYMKESRHSGGSRMRIS